MGGLEVPETPDMMLRFFRAGDVFTPSAPINNQALDEMGCFRAVDVRDPLSRISGKNYDKTSAFNRHLSQFCEESRGRSWKRKESNVTSDIVSQTL